MNKEKSVCRENLNSGQYKRKSSASSSIKHKNLRNIFILLFAVISELSSFAGSATGFWFFFLLQILIAAAMYILFRTDDKPFAIMSLYILIGLLISLVLVLIL